MKKGRRFYVIIGVTVLLGLAVAIFFQELSDRVPVVVAVGTLPVGTMLDKSDIEVVQMAAGAVFDDAFTTVADAVGQRLAVARRDGEQITVQATGSSGLGRVTGTLPPDWRAVGIHVSKAQGLAGLPRAGDVVDVIGLLDVGRLAGGGASGVVARVAIHNAQVLLVPQEFRYEEQIDDEGGLQAASRDEAALLLAVPAAPISLTLPVSGTVTGLTVGAKPLAVSPVELLALLDNYGELHLALVPEAGVEVKTPGLRLGDLVAWLAPQGVVR